MIDAALADLDQHARGSVREIEERIEEYAVECSIVKVWVTEMFQMVSNHAVQIHGGYGYVEEYPAERAYRAARIDPIFEGTNEINRLIITGWLSCADWQSLTPQTRLPWVAKSRILCSWQGATAFRTES